MINEILKNLTEASSLRIRVERTPANGGKSIRYDNNDGQLSIVLKIQGDLRFKKDVIILDVGSRGLRVIEKKEFSDKDNLRNEYKRLEKLFVTIAKEIPDLEEGIAHIDVDDLDQDEETEVDEAIDDFIDLVEYIVERNGYSIRKVSYSQTKYTIYR